MRIFGITRAGFTAIAICVFALWSCLALEGAALVRARKDSDAMMRTMERLRERSLPAPAPVPPFAPASVRAS